MRLLQQLLLLGTFLLTFNFSNNVYRGEIVDSITVNAVLLKGAFCTAVDVLPSPEPL